MVQGGIGMSFLSMSELDQIDVGLLRTEKQRRAVAALREVRGDVADAADLLGWKRQHVYDMIFRLRKKGLLRDPRPCPLRRRLWEARDMSLGSVSKHSREAPFEVRQWLAQEVPEGGDIVSFAFAVFADVMEEEG